MEEMETGANNKIESQIGFKTEKALSTGPSRCSNCYRKLGSKCRASKQFYYEFQENETKVQKHVLISDAVKEIYQWRLFGFPKASVEESFDSANIVVCGELCGIAIAKLYGAIKVFDSLAHTSSDLFLQTKKLLENFVKVDAAVISGSIDRRTHIRSSKLKQSQNLGSEILNRPVTQYLSKNNRKDKQIEQDTVEIRILNSENYVDVHDGTVYHFDESTLPQEDTKFECDDNNAEPETKDDEDSSDYIYTFTPKPAINKPFLCQICGAGLTSRQGLRTHELLTHKIGSKTTKTFSCEVCNKEFFYAYLLRNHEACHNQIRSFACTMCELKFKGRHSLYQHQRDVHCDDERKYKCKICPNKAFKHHRTLWDHMLSIHGNKGGKQLFVCKYGCGSTTSRTRSLLSHYRKCKKRPIEEISQDQQNQLQNAVESIKDSTPGKASNLDDGGKRRAIYVCKWDCGKKFTDASYRNKHNIYVCRKRPNKSIRRSYPTKKPKVKQEMTVIKRDTTQVPIDVNEEVQDEMETIEGVTVDEETFERVTEERIEVETVFEEVIVQ